MTRDRVPCTIIINALRETGQAELAEKLNKFNTSSGPRPLSLDIKITVNKRTIPQKDLSNCYNLVQKRRGRCIIINNVEDRQRGTDRRGLKRETLRFVHTFRELHFDVKVLTKLSADQSRKRLTEISKDPTLKDDAAFVLIYISHGEEECVLGFNACEANRKIEFGQISADDPDALKQMDNDVIKIKEIINIFSDTNCPQLNSKPKLHFYICCRVKKPNGKIAHG